MKYLTKLRKDIYYTRDKRVAIILEEMGIEGCIVDYKRDGNKKIEFGWGFLIKEGLADILSLLNKKLG